MKSSSTFAFGWSLTLALQAYLPISFSETFVMCREKSPLLFSYGSKYFSLAFLFVSPLIIWSLNFHWTSVSIGFTLRPRHCKVTLEPCLATTVARIAVILGMIAVASVNNKNEVFKENFSIILNVHWKGLDTPFPALD